MFRLIGQSIWNREMKEHKRYNLFLLYIVWVDYELTNLNNSIKYAMCSQVQIKNDDYAKKEDNT